MSTPDETDSRFSRACDYVAQHASSLPADQLVSFYGLYKQATVGRCDTPKPFVFDLRARAMWKSWSQLGSMSATAAKLRYVQLLDAVAADWQSSAGGGGWNRVSSPTQEQPLPDSAKDAFDWAKEGDVRRLRQLSAATAVNSRDDGGLTLLHWAADRGHLDVVRYLVTEVKADVNCVDNDGQTPLHYAAACGYVDVCRFLVDSRAEVTAKDGEGLAPLDLAEEAAVKELLGGLKIG